MNPTLLTLIFFAFLLIFMGFVWSLASMLMEPIILQRRRESMCQHEFQEFNQADTGAGVHISTRFCPKCAAVRTLGYGLTVGTVKKHPPKNQQARGKR